MGILTDNNLNFLNVIAARSVRHDILQGAQDGGAVTTLLIAGLKNRYIDTAIVMDRDEEWRSIPVIARKEETILKAMGSKYVYKSLVPKLREAAQRDEIRSIAFIGVPCQINALKAFEKSGLKQIIDKIKVKICLFCTHSWDWKALKDICDEAKVNLSDINKIDIKGKLLFFTKDGNIIEYPLDKAEERKREGCRLCEDFISSYADIAVGSIGSPGGWSTITILSDRGREFVDIGVKSGLLETKPVTEKGINKIMKFVHRKREEALKYKRERG